MGPKTIPGPKPVPVLERLAAKTEYDPATGCLNFTGERDKDGYGKVRVGSMTDGTRRRVMVHRIAWLTLVGPIPPNLVLDHFRCDNPSCWNVTHMRPVTQRENTLRGNTRASANAAKTHCPCGEPYDWIDGRGFRRHRACWNAYWRAYWSKRGPRLRTKHPAP